MSVNRKRTMSECEKCHGARPSRFGRWCDRCWAELTHEERLAAADEAALAEDHDPRLAPNRLARKGEGNGNGDGLRKWDMIVDSTRARRYWEAQGYTLSTLATTPFRSHIYYREVPEDEAR